MVESQPSKLLVAGSIPVSRSNLKMEIGKGRHVGRSSSFASFDFPISGFSARGLRGGPM